MCVRVVRGDAVGDLLENRGLAGLRRRHDQPALAGADRGDEVDGALRDCFRACFQREVSVGKDGSQGLEVRPPPRDFGVEAIDGLDA